MKSTSKISAFTILEVTIVIALMSILIGVISSTYNRFNEQLKLSNDLHQELNEWYALRSNLWTELYQSDSIQFDSKILQLSIHDHNIEYKVVGGNLFRKHDSGDWASLHTEIEQIYLNRETNEIVFDFSWKGDQMLLRFPKNKDLSLEINSYFSSIK